jgi:PHP family Zn ribbon phosphoesterase
MSPRGIIEKCRECKIDIVAICDHNSAENARTAVHLGRESGIAVFSGMEICSREEVHILSIFRDVDEALDMQNDVYLYLEQENQPEIFGYQIVTNENNEVIGENTKLLIGATDLSLSEIARKTHALGGIVLASHVDRPAYGLLNQLGCIPEELELDAVEVSYRIPLQEISSRLPGISDYPCITSSDAHRLDEIGRASTKLRLSSPTFEEIVLALQGLEGRGIEV